MHKFLKVRLLTIRVITLSTTFYHLYSLKLQLAKLKVYIISAQLASLRCCTICTLQSSRSRLSYSRPTRNIKTVNPYLIEKGTIPQWWCVHRTLHYGLWLVAIRIDKIDKYSYHIVLSNNIELNFNIWSCLLYKFLKTSHV